jgi:heme exporter protein A
MLQVKGLVKSFGHTHVLREVSLEVGKGRFLTVVGPNGAGKTTLLRILATLLKPTRGLVDFDGLDLVARSAEVRRHIGYVSHQSLTYSKLTVEENLTFYGKLYDVPAVNERVEMLLNLVGLAGRRYDSARTLSRGMHQRLSIARAIVHQPSLLLLDEPYTGLDQQAAEMLRNLLQTITAEARTVVMTTHNLQRALDLCDTVAILAKGRLVYQAENDSLSLEDLQQAYWHHVANASSRGQASK